MQKNKRLRFTVSSSNSEYDRHVREGGKVLKTRRNRVKNSWENQKYNLMCLKWKRKDSNVIKVENKTLTSNKAIAVQISSNKSQKHLIKRLRFDCDFFYLEGNKNEKKWIGRKNTNWFKEKREVSLETCDFSSEILRSVIHHTYMSPDNEVVLWLLTYK